MTESYVVIFMVIYGVLFVSATEENSALGSMEKVCMTSTVASSDGHLILIAVFKQVELLLVIPSHKIYLGSMVQGLSHPHGIFFLSMFVIVYTNTENIWI